MTKSVFLGLSAHGLLMLSLLGLAGCYSTVEVGDGPTDKAIAIDWVEPACAEPGSDAGYIEGNGFGAKNVTVTVGGIEAQVLAAAGHDASFVVPYGIPSGQPIEVVVTNPGGRLATIQWVACEETPGWGTPEIIDMTDPDHTEQSHQQVALDANGDAIAVWRDSGPPGSHARISAARYTKGMGWGVPEYIDASEPDARGAIDPQVAIDPNGNATVVWTERNSAGGGGVWSARYIPGNGWGPAEIVQADEEYFAERLKVAVDPSGHAIAVWERRPGTSSSARIWSARYSPATGWGAAEIIQADETPSLHPEVGVDASGNFVAVWDQGGVHNWTIRANRYTPGNGWGVAEVINNNLGTSPTAPQVTVDPNGNATALWDENDEVLGGSRLWFNRYTPGNGWGVAEVTGPSVSVALDVTSAAVDPEGNVTAVWTGIDSASETHVGSTRYTPGDGWSPVEIINDVTPTTPSTMEPQVAVDPNGTAVAVWYQWAGNTIDIWSNRYTPSGGWGAAELVEDIDGFGTAAVNPQVAVDPAGNAMAVWKGGDGSRFRIWSNRYE